jgi:hypothetical protein
MVAKVIDTQHGKRLELVGNHLDVSAAICYFIEDKAPINIASMSISARPEDSRRFVLALWFDLYSACDWFNVYPHNLRR